MKALPGSISTLARTAVVVFALHLFLGTGVVAKSRLDQAPSVKWAGKGKYRITVRVDPLNLGTRLSDEGVAEVTLDPYQWKLHRQNVRIDLNSVQVIKYSVATGEAEPFGASAYQLSKYDRPFRFYDQSLNDEFSTYVGYISEDVLAGRPLRQAPMKYGHRFFNPSSPGLKGKLVWVHTQLGTAPSYYAIYFDLLPAAGEPLIPPAGFVGDGSNRVTKESSLSSPIGGGRGTSTDWNNDGLFDVLYGTASGNLILLQNAGSARSPDFAIRKILYDSGGQPIDIGFAATPHVVDWNRDGKKDVLVGAERGCVVYYQNVGTDSVPLLKFSGLLRADDKILETPNWPIAELEGKGTPGSVYKKDYAPTPFAVDWENDGDLDLLVGGFVTGRVYLYENGGRQAAGIPLLVSRGPLNADGEIIDTGWGAAPVLADLDNDGDLDLICGAKPQTTTGGDTSDPDRLLFYYENIGTRAKPLLKHRDFPKTGILPTAVTVMPSLVDTDHDGLRDLLLVSHSTQEPTFVLKNVGSKTKPLFDVRATALRAHWNAEMLPYGDRLEDWDNDGSLDIITYFRVAQSTDRRFPTFFAPPRDLTAGVRISHEHAHGDENPGMTIYDVDGDGVLDILYGTHSGYVWFHRNRGSDQRPDWDTAGTQMQLENAKPIKVGLPEGVQPGTFDFTVLQGARPKFAPADYNGDGLTDLIIGDTFGKVRYFENRGDRNRARFAEPTLIFESKSRLQVAAGDWNSDGRSDLFIILGSKVYLLENENLKNQSRFKAPKDMNVPVSHGGFVSVMIADFNRDGDLDLVYNTSHYMTCWLEGTFQRNGYQRAQVSSVERQPK